MILITLGLALWIAVHYWKRLAPAHRAGMGDKGKGLVAIGVVAAIVLMVFGYRAAEGTVYWGRSGALVGINNLLMVVSFYIYSCGAAPPGKPRNLVGTKLRHPQLVGFIVWGIAHLLVNGDSPSFLLFGGLLVWAIGAIILINRAEPNWTPPAYGGAKSEIRVAVISVIMLVIVMLIHNWLGVRPWG